MPSTVTWSAIHLGSIADIDTDEGNSSAENPSALIGTYGSDSDRLASHVTEITSTSLGDNDEDVEDGGNDFAIDMDHTSSSETISYDLGSGTQTVHLDTGALVTGTVTFTDGTTATTTLGVVQDDSGNLFLLISDSQASLSAKPIESLEITSVNDTNFATANQLSRDNLQFVCFAPGTTILTPDGDMPVERLVAGDLVHTFDDGPRTLLWVGVRTLLFPDSPPGQKPVHVPAGALGLGIPKQDLVISPQHRVLVNGPAVRQNYEFDQGLAPVKGLIGINGIRQMAGKRRITYYTLLFQRHQVIFANGAPVESFLARPYSLSLLEPAQRHQIYEHLPLLRFFPKHGYGPPSRHLLTVRETARLGRKALEGQRAKTARNGLIRSGIPTTSGQ